MKTKFFIDDFYRRHTDPQIFNVSTRKEPHAMTTTTVNRVASILAAISLFGLGTTMIIQPTGHIAMITLTICLITAVLVVVLSRLIEMKANKLATNRAEQAYQDLLDTKSNDLDELEHKFVLARSKLDDMTARVKEAEKHLEYLTNRASSLNDFTHRLEMTRLEQYRNLLPAIQASELNDLFESRKAIETIIERLKRLHGLDDDVYSCIEDDGKQRMLYAVRYTTRSCGTCTDNITFFDFFGNKYKLPRTVVDEYDKSNPLSREYEFKDSPRQRADLWREHHLILQDISAEMARQETINLLGEQVKKLDERIDETTQVSLYSILATITEHPQIQ